MRRSMTHKGGVAPVLTGIATGAVIGTAAYMMSSHSKRRSHTVRNLKRNTGKALKTVGGIMENMSYMMK